MHKRVLDGTRVALSAVFVLALGLSVSACTTPQAAGTSGEPAAAKSATLPTMKLTAPAANAEVPAGDVAVKVETTGLEFVMPGAKLVAGQGHVHFTLDGGTTEMSAKPEYVFKDVKPGEHKLVAELVQNDAKPFDPPVKQEITFVAK